MVKLRSIFGRLNPHYVERVAEQPRTRQPARWNSDKGAGDRRLGERVAPARPPRALPRTPGGRRAVVEAQDSLAARYLKSVRVISPARNSVVITVGGKPFKIRLHWSRRVLPDRAEGWRAYFYCLRCGRRCCALFHADDGAPVCRFCVGLVYRCQSLYAPTRQRKRMLKIQRKLGLPDDRMLDRLERPKRMRRSVFAVREAQWWRARARIKARELNRKIGRRKTRPLITV
jgi:hypothetical protein